MVPSSITRWGWWGSGGGRKGLTAAPSPEVLGGHAQPPPNPRLFQAPAALTAGVEDDLHVPVVAVALSQGDTGGGGRGGPGVGIGTQRVGRALQAWGGDTQRWGQPRSALDHGHGPKDAARLPALMALALPAARSTPSARHPPQPPSITPPPRTGRRLLTQSLVAAAQSRGPARCGAIWGRGGAHPAASTTPALPASKQGPFTSSSKANS